MDTAFCLWVIFSLSSLSQAIPVPGHGALAGYCVTSEHCEPNQCCVRFRGPKPNIGGLERIVNGECKNLGSLYEDCTVGAPQTIPGLYNQTCPCQSNLYCRPDSFHIHSFTLKGRCRREMEFKG